MFAISLRHALALTSLVLACTAHASSFDCTDASGKTEKAICTDPYLSTLDDKLAEQWRTTLGKVVDPKTLKTDQRQWLKNRNACGALSACLRREYLMRVTELEHAVQPFSWDATWQLIPRGTSTSATVVTQRRDATHIAIDISAGEGANSGDLTGVAILKDGTAVYAEDACKLAFTPINGVLNVTQTGADSDCGGGVGVYYAGRYVASEQPLTLNYDLLSLGLARTSAEDQALRSLLKTDYQKLVETSGSLQVGEASRDLPDAQVVELWMRGLGGIGILMSAADAQVWLIFKSYDDQSHEHLRYYTNVAKWKKRLPDVLQGWYDRMHESQSSLVLEMMP
ncbi:lysozyme inhibitor LprI family protein [Pseudomonas sp. Marseille-Q5117]|uniref:lysozyme inhibitor LprI family protein n=1 Tax=Pseudomonas sp. Marseille-Q5117 TaxID=2972777 RepID=UPI0021C89421|nr:lysozyme inhibitor LprI family protein [Pseudomonas sp. Marseille-Q5117]